MPRHISKVKIEKIKVLRSRGLSLPEIYRKVGVGYGSVSKYIKGVKILPQYQQIWLNKRNGSKVKKERLERIANQKAKRHVVNLNIKEKLLFMAALYWGEGGKTDFNFTNSDSEMIRIFVNSLKEIFKISQEDIKASIRIYEDLDRNKCLDHWSEVTGIPVKEFVSVDVLKGKKLGKLTYGLCRIRIKRGGDMLKYLLAVNKRVSELFSMRSHSSTDRASAS